MTFNSSLRAYDGPNASDRKPSDYEIAWKIIMDSDSWNDSSNKTSILNYQIGISSLDDLQFIDADSIALIFDKIKIIP